MMPENILYQSSANKDGSVSEENKPSGSANHGGQDPLPPLDRASNNAQCDHSS